MNLTIKSEVIGENLLKNLRVGEEFKVMYVTERKKNVSKEETALELRNIVLKKLESSSL